MNSKRKTQNAKRVKLDELYMRRALHLARKGEGRVSPNPMVGAVIVKDGRIIGEGYHKKFGGPHAEIIAVESATEPLMGSTLYVTLEPCAHQGKTPPCVKRIIEARPSRVVIGTADPNPLVSGRSVAALKRQGIPADVGLLSGPCRTLNEKFFHFMETKRPFVTLKFAQTLDGRIATKTGHSQWISSQPSLRLAHRERSLHDAVLVGVGTVLKDDPELTVRLVRGRNPVRIIVDSALRIPLKAKILRDQDRAKTIIATALRGEKEKKKQLERMGVETLVIPAGRNGDVHLRRLLEALSKKNLSSVLVEGGSAVITSFLRDRLADRLLAVIAPKITGMGIEAVGDLGINKIDDSIKLRYQKIFRRGDDVIIEARFL